MNIVKPSKGWSLQRVQKKPFFSWIKNRNLLLVLLLASLAGTYLDLYFVGKGLYSFPIRPLKTIFSINIIFTLLLLPMMVGLFLYICRFLHSWQKSFLIFILSLFMSVMEKLSESIGFFVHLESWRHMYTFFGSFIYLSLLSFIYEKLED